MATFSGQSSQSKLPAKFASRAPRMAPVQMAVVISTGYEFSRELVLGAVQYCKSNGVNLLHLDSLKRQDTIQIQLTKTKGVIVFGFQRDELKRMRKLGLSLVNTSSRGEHLDVPGVFPDNRAIGRLGAEHLLSREFKSLAFLGFAEHRYSALRAEGFKAACEIAGVDCKISNCDQAPGQGADKSVSKWIRSLPPRTGLMCCNDIRSKHAVAAANDIGLRLPDDLAIIGVDNDRVICQSVEPKLSSVDPDAFRVGFEAAAMLHQIIEGERVEPIVLVPPKGVVPRASTYTLMSEDPDIRRALAVIHAGSREPVGVEDVAQNVGLSRRTLERLFREKVRCSIASVIRRAQLERAKQFLIDTDLPMDHVAELSGVQNMRRLRFVFSSALKTSPRQFRERYQRSGVITYRG